MLIVLCLSPHLSILLTQPHRFLVHEVGSEDIEAIPFQSHKIKGRGQKCASLSEDSEMTACQ